MALEDYNTYTEVDPNSRIVAATRRVAFTDLTINETAYVYSDKGAAFFDGDFVHHLTILITASDASMSVASGLWALANTVNDWNGMRAADCLDLYFTSQGATPNRKLTIEESNGGSITASSDFAMTVNTIYYLTIYRDESVGANGTLYCRIYSDASRRTLLTTLSVTLTEKQDFQYIYALASRSTVVSLKHSGYTENLQLFDSLTEALEVTTEATTSISSTTATGHGTIVDAGLSSVTAHGHAWNTSIDPVTGDNNVDNGAGSAGVFTSAITGLLVGQVYFARAYATNSEGTSYGANVKFTANTGGTQLIPGNLTVKETRLQYVDKFGTERYLEGTPV